MATRSNAGRAVELVAYVKAAFALAAFDSRVTRH